MLKYSKYLYINILSRKTFWIALFLSIATISTLGILHIINVNNVNRAAIYSIDQNDKFLPFILSSLLTALVIVYIFKTGQSDGTDLLVAAKPISRLKMIAGKFIVLIVFLIGIQLVMFLMYFSYAQQDKFATGKIRFRYALALSVGGLIIQFIVASLVTLAALFISKVGLIMITLLGAAVMPIISMIIGPISLIGPSGVEGATGTYTLISDKYYKDVTKKLDGIYSELDKEIVKAKTDIVAKPGLSSISDERWKKAGVDLNIYEGINYNQTHIRHAGKKFVRSSEKYLKDRWYKKAAPFDIWYHWSSFYDQILPKSVDTHQLWNPVKRTIGYDTSFSMNPITKTNKGDIFSKIFLVSSNHTAVYAGKHLSNIQTIFDRIIKPITRTKKLVIPFEDMFKNADYSFYERMNAIMDFTQGKSRDHITYATYIIYTRLVEYYKKQKTGTGAQVYAKPTRIFPAAPVTTTGKTNQYDEDIDGRYLWSDSSHALSENAQSWLQVKGDKVEIWEPTPYVKQSTRIWIWGAFVVFLFGSVVFIYYRKDFK